MNTKALSVATHPLFSMPEQIRSKWLRALLIWGLATLFYFYDNLLQVSPSAMKPELFQAFVQDAEQFGSLSAYCLYAYGLMQIPAGVLMDRFGPKRILTLACVFCGIGSLVFGIATTLWEAKFGRMMIGVGAAFALVGCLEVAGFWFSAKRFALITGLTITVGYLGAVFGLSTVSKIVEIFGWRVSMQWGGCFGLLLGTVLWLVIPTGPQNAALEKSEAKNSTFMVIGPFQGLLQVMRHQQTWIAALFAGFMFVPTVAFGGLWGIPFLVEAHGFDRVTAGFCISLIYLGWAIGAPFWGFVSDYFKVRNLPMRIATLVTLVNCLAVIYLDHLPLPFLQMLLFTLGFFSSGFIVAFAVVREMNPPLVAATAIGFTNALNTLWGALAQPLIGKILDLSRTSLRVEEQEIFSLTQYQNALIVLPIALIISFILLLFLQETQK